MREATYRVSVACGVNCVTDVSNIKWTFKAFSEDTVKNLMDLGYEFRMYF